MLENFHLKAETYWPVVTSWAVSGEELGLRGVSGVEFFRGGTVKTVVFS